MICRKKITQNQETKTFKKFKKKLKYLFFTKCAILYQKNNNFVD